ncbi:MAG: pyrroline-5-carboxylate reductase [Tissierellia bacterium]|nr:pyrroline-5-carboxylate reductase [Tissierellia bacterium]
MTIAFIGLGNMGLAMLQGIKNNTNYKPIYTVKTKASGERLTELLGYPPVELDEIYNADLIFLAVKPKNYPEILRDLAGRLKEQQILITMAPGFSLAQVRSYFDFDVKVLRSMPATPAQIGKSVSALSFSSSVSDEEKLLLTDLFRSFGWVHELEENLMEAFSSLCGVMPAFMMKLIEAMADRAVAWGIPRKEAYTMAAQIMEGSAGLVLETGLHPAQLKDQVTSPAGTTIEGILALEEWGAARAIQKAMEASYNKGKSMEAGPKD